jgi:hypothetical protein
MGVRSIDSVACLWVAVAASLGVVDAQKADERERQVWFEMSMFRTPCSTKDQHS